VRYSKHPHGNLSGHVTITLPAWLISARVLGITLLSSTSITISLLSLMSKSESKSLPGWFEWTGSPARGQHAG